MLHVIKADENISEFESERWSEAYAKQIERGVLVLSNCHKLYSYGELMYLEDDGTTYIDTGVIPQEFNCKVVK